MKCAIYIRVSTRKQNVASQRDYIKHFCKENNHEIVEEYVDEISGATKDRPAIKRLLGDCKLDKFDCVVVYKLDRFGRSVSDLNYMLNYLKDNNISFISATQPFDTSTPMGKLIFNLLSMVAEFNRELILERVEIGKERARKFGTKSGKPMHRPRIVLPKKEVEKFYCEYKISISKCAEIFHVSKTTMKNILVQYGFHKKKT